MIIKIYNSWELNPNRIYFSAHEMRRIYKSIVLSKIVEINSSVESLSLHFVDNHWSNKIYLDLFEIEQVLGKKFKKVNLYSDNPLDSVNTNIKYLPGPNLRDDSFFVHKTVNQNLQIDLTSLPQYKFGYCIQRPDLNRLSLLLNLFRLNITSWFPVIGFNEETLTSPDYWRQSSIDYFLLHYDLKPSEFWNYLNKIKISDIDDFSTGCIEGEITNNLQHNYTNVTFCLDIVAESTFADDIFHLSEKTLRPMLLKQPFIIFGSQHYYKFLKYLGFKTFSEFWDESWDTLDQHNIFEKSRQIADTVRFVDEKFTTHELIEQTKEITEHNYQQCIRLFSNNNKLYIEKHQELANGASF